MQYLIISNFNYYILQAYNKKPIIKLKANYCIIINLNNKLNNSANKKLPKNKLFIAIAKNDSIFIFFQIKLQI